MNGNNNGANSKSRNQRSGDSPGDNFVKDFQFGKVPLDDAYLSFRYIINGITETPTLMRSFPAPAGSAQMVSNFHGKTTSMELDMAAMWQEMARVRHLPRRDKPADNTTNPAERRGWLWVSNVAKQLENDPLLDAILQRIRKQAWKKARKDARRSQKDVAPTAADNSASDTKETKDMKNGIMRLFEYGQESDVGEDAKMMRLLQAYRSPRQVGKLPNGTVLGIAKEGNTLGVRARVPYPLLTELDVIE